MQRDPHLEAETRKLEEHLARAQREWEQIFDAIPTAVGVLAPDGTVVRANRAFAVRAGLTSGGVVGFPCHEVFCLRGQACADHGVDCADAAAGTYEVRGRDGRLMALEVIDHPDGAQRICLLRDITDERNQLTEVVQQEKMVAMAQLASGIAHEIKNPLAGILAFTQIMRREPGRGSEDAESLELIEQSAVRCKEIVDTMLRFARRADDQELFDPVAPVSDALALFRMFLKTVPRARLEVELAEALPAIKANPNHLQQVVLDLLHHAAQALPEGKGRIRLSTASCDGWVCIQVTGDGVGIPAGHLERLFDARSTSSPTGTGTGLGLAIARRLVNVHAGRIEVRSDPGRGAEFTVRFPVAEEEEEA